MTKHNLIKKDVVADLGEIGTPILQLLSKAKPITLELAKIVVDTSYYGWLITYAQLNNIISIRNNIDYPR